ncbi:hypothetical protein [Spirosoma agri]|uniref:Uncharacterized protein n=1 Tax=Spirosoma agri TaxID=1987381 RepID=A0A6M0IQA1_9BACT|nr:hypothetical protein [Spirosoma agri]NEU69551.1 hypothetical protein [Spirosoma agri]
MPCDDVRIWSSARAYKLYQTKTDYPAWRKQFWPYIAEHYVADYKASVNKLNLFPCLDSDYRRWGGRQQRPTPRSIDL